MTVPVTSSFTCTPMKALSVPQPNGAQPTVRSDLKASVSKRPNGMLCCSKKRLTSALLAPTLISWAASRLMLSTSNANALPRTLQRYPRIPSQPSNKIRTTAAITNRRPRILAMTLVSGATQNLGRPPCTAAFSRSSVSATGEQEGSCRIAQRNHVS